MSGLRAAGGVAKKSAKKVAKGFSGTLCQLLVKQTFQHFSASLAPLSFSFPSIIYSMPISHSI